MGYIPLVHRWEKKFKDTVDRFFICYVKYIIYWGYLTEKNIYSSSDKPKIRRPDNVESFTGLNTAPVSTPKKKRQKTHTQVSYSQHMDSFYLTYLIMQMGSFLFI